MVHACKKSKLMASPIAHGSTIQLLVRTPFRAFPQGVGRFPGVVLTFFSCSTCAKMFYLSSFRPVAHVLNTLRVFVAPNASLQLLPEAGATKERRLEAVSCTP